MFSKIKLYLILFVVLGLVVAAAYGYFKWSQNQIQALAQEVATLNAKNAILEKGIETLNADAALVKKATEEHNQQINQIREDAAKQQKALRDNDLAEMGMANSKDLEQRVNRATKSRLKALEDLSRAH